VNVIALFLFVGTFVAIVARQVVGKGPDLWILLVGGGLLTVATGVLPPVGAAATLIQNLPVFLFLIALFLFVAALDVAGVFEYLARWVLGQARNAADVPLLLFVGFALLAAFLVNDALVLVGVPLVFAVARRLAGPVRPLLIVVAFAVTVGSVLTPMGNPQNLLVALGSGLRAPIATFLRYLLLPTAINIGLGALYVRWRFRSQFAPEGTTPAERFPRLPLLPPGDWPHRLVRFPVLLVFPVTMGVLIGTDLVGELTGAAPFPIDVVAILGGLVVLGLSSQRVRLLRRLDWSILLLFAGLFLLVAGAQVGGVIARFEQFLPIPGAGAPRIDSVGAILATSLLGPQLFSNVPWVAVQIPALHALGYGPGTPVAWVALAAGSTLAGNLTLLGAASNLIIVEQAEARGVRLRLVHFVRDGAPLVALTTAVLLACLAFGV
jgi:Na+/H+ antiporter NhaD/arsenite permease-like protein